MIKQQWNLWLDNLGLRVSSIDALPQLAMLAIPVGLLSGGVIILFRLLVESTQGLFLPGGGTENYEMLQAVTRLLLPAIGGLLVGLIWQYLKDEARQVGVTHVMERLTYHQGRLSLRNAAAQFFGAAICIISGHSVGREGPSVHLGAASGSQLGQWLRLPNNSNRTLVACGVAAAIAASFNTPLAGVIFSMEVIMMEYSLVSFAPVILSAVTATTITRLVFGDSQAFSIPALQMGSLLELPYIILTGIVIGLLAALFIYLLKRTTSLTNNWPIWLRCTLGGIAVGILAMVTPEIMGIGYDTVNQALLGQIGLTLLVSIAVMKILATTIGLGLGLPGGLIGPTLVIGGTAGGAMGVMAATWLPGEFSSPAFYALIGMGAMMGATLQAPLAALTAMLELTGNPNIILPGMLALITGGLISREVFKLESVYLVLMQVRGLDYRHNPLSQTLQRIGVASVMEKRFRTLPHITDIPEAIRQLENAPVWIIVTKENAPVRLMPAANLARYIADLDDNEENEAPLELLKIPAERFETATLDFTATLQEAYEILNKEDTEALLITRRTIHGIDQIHGILTSKEIDRSYKV